MNYVIGDQKLVKQREGVDNYLFNAPIDSNVWGHGFVELMFNGQRFHTKEPFLINDTVAWAFIKDQQIYILELFRVYD